MFIIKTWTAEDRKKVEEFLKRVRALLPTNNITFMISEKNQEFDRKYNLKHEKKLNIVKELQVDDCIKIDKNNNPKYPDAEVYIFIKSVALDSYGEDEQIEIYLKGYITIDKHMEMVIVISFHEEGVYE